MNKLVYMVLLIFVIVSVNLVSANDVDNETLDTLSVNDGTESVNLSLNDESFNQISDNDKNHLLNTGSGESVENSNNNPLLKDDNSLSLDLSNSIKSNDVTKYYKSSTPYNAAFYNEFGDSLSGTYVKRIHHNSLV